LVLQDLAGGAIFGLGIFNIAINVEASGAPWIYKALAASIPYAISLS